MNNSWIEKVISDFFTTNIDIFGERCEYDGFEMKKLIQNSLDGIQSDQLHGNIKYRDKKNNIHKSLPVFIKLTPDNPAFAHSFISFSFANEINFYAKIFPAMNNFNDSFSSLFPKFFHGEMIFNQKQNKCAIIFEDLKTRGYELAEKRAFQDYQHLALMMRKLGTFHAYSYKAKNTSPDLFYRMKNIYQENNYYVNRERSDVLKKLAQRGFQVLQQDPEYVKYSARIKAMIENADDIFRQILTGDREHPTSVITHGDYLRNNLMFRYKNGSPDDLIMIDMATYRYASPVIDLLTVLYINADQATRDKYWDKLIDEYYAALKGTFPDNEVPSKNAIMSDFVGRSFYVYLTASFFLPRLIENDYNIPLPQDIDPDTARKYYEREWHEISEENLLKLSMVLAGDQETQAVKNVLQDIIDRGFICK